MVYENTSATEIHPWALVLEDDFIGSLFSSSPDLGGKLISSRSWIAWILQVVQSRSIATRRNTYHLTCLSGKRYYVRSKSNLCNQHIQLRPMSQHATLLCQALQQAWWFVHAGNITDFGNLKQEWNWFQMRPPYSYQSSDFWSICCCWCFRNPKANHRWDGAKKNM